MKLDYDFLKKILETMEQEDSHLIPNTALAAAVGVDLEKEKQFDKFAGHIKILADERHIDCKNEDLGFPKRLRMGNFQTVEYRMTERGYELLDMLKNKSAFNRMKNFSLSFAVEIGKAYLLNKLIKAA